MLPPGKSFEFILEREKFNNICKIISRNGGEIITETDIEGGIKIKVMKAAEPD